MKKIKIRSLGSAGEGVGVVDGIPIFVAGALPDEEVMVRCTVKKSRYAKGELLEVLTASNARTEPFCPLFPKCGGCQIQHLDYAGQLEAKRERVANALRRIGHLDVEVLPCLEAPSPHSYRNKIQMPVRENGIGFYEHGSHRIVSVEQCPIHRAAGEAAYKAIRPLLDSLEPYCEESGKGLLRHLVIKSSRLEERALVILVTTGRPSKRLKSVAEAMVAASPAVAGVVENINRKRGNSILTGEFRPLAGEPHLWEELCGKRFRISPASFFQVNPDQAERLYQTALSFLNPPKDARLLDAFCGVGTLSIIASDQVASVVGIEAVPQAVEDARANAEANKAKNCSFLCGKVEERIQGAPPFDYALLNPPRKGCERAVLEALSERRPKRIVYLSCDPATLARDLSILENQGFKTNRVQPVDMFPQTMHVESVALLTPNPV